MDIPISSADPPSWTRSLHQYQASVGRNLLGPLGELPAVFLLIFDCPGGRRGREFDQRKLSRAFHCCCCFYCCVVVVAFLAKQQQQQHISFATGKIVTKGFHLE